jgi:hypothetical protein
MSYGLWALRCGLRGDDKKKRPEGRFGEAYLYVFCVFMELQGFDALRSRQIAAILPRKPTGFERTPHSS